METIPEIEDKWIDAEIISPLTDDIDACFYCTYTDYDDNKYYEDGLRLVLDLHNRVYRSVADTIFKWKPFQNLEING